MLLPSPLYPGTLLRRYKRFLADVMLDDGQEVTAHCADPGRMPTLSLPGRRVWLSRSDKPGRKLPFGLELAREDGALVGVNSSNPNRIANQAIAAGLIPALAGWRVLAREPRVADGTRLDFLLGDGADGRMLVEVKGVTWRRAGVAVFPDAPTERGRRHLAHLARLADQGTPTAMLFIAQRQDVSRFAVAADVDPGYARALDQAQAAGVLVEAWRCRVNFSEISMDSSLL
ncbi:DNA/RNA nuclease SfsA [Geminicoccaceae bacterium 1502E]|nr:DNA/RNA nuclease SfsA [Geminicoccaceae bacterium 1502E]